MNNCKIFYVKTQSETKIFIIDISMEDKLNTHRYYLLKYKSNTEYDYLRIKNIDAYLHLLDVNSERLVDFSDIFANTLKPENRAYESNLTAEDEMDGTGYNGGLLSRLGDYDVKVLEKVFDDDNRAEIWRRI